MAALLVLPAAPAAVAQVGPDAQYFEIDGDYRSELTVQEPKEHTLPALKITDGEGANRHTTYAPKQGDGRPPSGRT
jgi:hypothetical protein